MIDNQPPGPLAHLGVSAHIPDGISGEERAWLEEQRAEATDFLLSREFELGRTERMEEAFRAGEEREERERRESRRVDGVHSYCAGCGQLRPLWDLDLVVVPPEERPPGAPRALRMICKAHGAPAVRAPAHRWVRITRPVMGPMSPSSSLQSRQAVEAGMATYLFPPARPLPQEVPERMTVGFWRRLTGRRGKPKEAWR